MNLKPCPCGATPAELYIADGRQGGKWAYAYGDCCGIWEIEFRTDYHELDTDKCMENAIDAWNCAPRNKKGAKR